MEFEPPEMQTKFKSSFQIFKFYLKDDLNLWIKMSKKQSLQTLSCLLVKLGGFVLHLKHLAVFTRILVFYSTFFSSSTFTHWDEPSVEHVSDFPSFLQQTLLDPVIDLDSSNSYPSTVQGPNSGITNYESFTSSSL